MSTSKRQRDLFESLFSEYKKFVNDNMRFPTITKDGITSKGTKLSSWRRNTLRIGREEFKECLIAFDKSMIPIFTEYGEIQKEQKRIQKEQKIFEKFIDEKWLGIPNRPKTITEYMEGDNKYRYFGLQDYFRIMKHFNMLTRKDNFVSLIYDIYGVKDITWKTYRHWYVDDVEQVVSEVLSEMAERRSGGPSYERNVHVLKLYYGLYEDGRPMTLEEVGKIIDVGRERVRQIIRKGLRLLRHPSRSRRFLKKRSNFSPGKKNYPNPNEHIFVITGSGYGIKSIQLPMEAVEEALESFGYKTYGSDAKYYIKSIETHTLYEESINEYILAAIAPPYSLDMRLITYTEISLEYIVPFDINEHLKNEKRILDQRAAEERRRLEREEYDRQRKKESQRMYDELLEARNQMEEWNNMFSIKILSILDYIPLDNEGKWIPVFNNFMNNYLIPLDYQPIVLKTLEYHLKQRIKGFNISVIFTNLEKFRSIMKLRWNGRF